MLNVFKIEVFAKHEKTHQFNTIYFYEVSKNKFIAIELLNKKLLKIMNSSSFIIENVELVN